MQRFLLRPALAVLGALGLSAAIAAPGQDPAVRVDYARDVRPILEANCYECHGAEKQRARLRLDRRDAALAGSVFSEGTVIVAGDRAASVLYQRITAEEDERMPPVGEALSAEQVEILGRWLDEGADWPQEEESGARGAAGETAVSEHWAYRKPERPPLPTVEAADWVRNPIDAFVLARLEAEGLGPSPQADPAVLLRRASLDLVGLPPTLEQLDAFLADQADGAYERAVDRLLASPHYGEHQARAWLDQARYADSHGYEKDASRTMWRYRDWVIDAYNRDLPFDEFTIQQLAGDLLPEPTRQQLIATGFHRNTMVNEEGGIDPEEFRVAAVVDRVNTTAEVWLGSTMACAQCHNHKFDPFLQKEYYQLFAFFNTTTDTGNSIAPHIDAPTTAMEARLPELEEEIARAKAALDSHSEELGLLLDAWLEQARPLLPRWAVAVPGSATSDEGTPLRVLEDDSILAEGEAADRDRYVLVFTTEIPQIRALRLEALPHETLPRMGPGRNASGNFVVSSLSLEVRPRGAAGDAWQSVAWKALRASHEQGGADGFTVTKATDDQPKTGWAVFPFVAQPHQAILEPKDALESASGWELRLTLDFGYGTSHSLGRLRLSATEDDASRVDRFLPPRLEERLRTASGFAPEERSKLEAWHRSWAPELVPIRESLEVLQAELAALPKAPVMKEQREPRTTHVLEGGSFLSPAEEVEPGVPAVLHDLPADAPPDRLGLALWLVDPENPLTARVTVNRIWQEYFGTGLVATGDDFGTQGDAPSHPALLDWLATELMRREWSLKALHRLIVTSSTYRQSSRATRELLSRDPDNRLLARGPRFRVPAETVRDVALVSSGLLDSTIGGPSVFPPQPAGTWIMTYSGEQWTDSTGGDRHRRGLYTFWRRTVPYPSFALFDAPSRELACTRRDRSNTPLQALVTLNDPAFVECAAALARRMMREAGPAAADRAEHGFRCCVARRPRPEERSALLELFEVERDRYAADAEAARALAGALPGDAATDLDAAELAAWTVVANVLLNLDETLSKG